MAIQVQLRRGTTAQNNAFTGAVGEVTVDTTKDTLVVHDGAQAGGFPLAKESGSAISATNLSYTGTLTGGTGVVNLGSGQFYKDASGNVGIGTSSPDAGGLHINSSSGSLTLQRSGTGFDAKFRLVAGGLTGGGFRIQENTIDRLVIDTAGNVGIGTISPSFATGDGLHIQRTGSATVRVERTNATASAGEFFAGNDQVVIQSLTATAPLAFRTGGNPATERMRIDSAGNVGIGTTSPTTKLHISGGGINIGNFGTGAQAVGIRTTGTQVDATTDAQECFRVFRVGVGETFKVTGAGAVSKASGSFKIPHPLPDKNETHYLVHSFVEGPQADNIYRGKVELVAGRADVNIDTAAGMSDGTFVALNREVQCFTSNESDWDAVRGSVSGNILSIECQNTESTATVSWLVIGERQDKHMYDTDWTDENGKVIVEPLKNPQPTTEGN